MKNKILMNPTDNRIEYADTTPQFALDIAGECLRGIAAENLRAHADSAREQYSAYWEVETDDATYSFSVKLTKLSQKEKLSRATVSDKVAESYAQYMATVASMGDLAKVLSLATKAVSIQKSAVNAVLTREIKLGELADYFSANA